MKPRFRRVVVFVGTAALAAGSGPGVAAATGDASSDSNRAAHAGASRPAPPRGADMTAASPRAPAQAEQHRQ